MRIVLATLALLAVATKAQTSNIVRCTPSEPCGECQGDCTTDDDCEGDLVCLQVIGRGTGVLIPGCSMKPVFSKTDFCVNPGADIPEEPSSRTCVGESMSLDEGMKQLLSTINNTVEVIAGLMMYASEGYTIGSTTALVPEASDASITGAPIVDGKSGDIDFPHGSLKVLATVGERSVCESSIGTKLTGPPDGNGSILKDDDTVRVFVQSESYGPVYEAKEETWGFAVNAESDDVTYNDAIKFTGSHIQYVDYDREMFANFMEGDFPASDMVVGFGEAIQKVVNLNGDFVGKRVLGGPTTVGAHYGNTDANGTWAYINEIQGGSDWFFQSFCSAHLEEKHQWGKGIGVEDDLFITNEEWAAFEPNRSFVGLGVHVLDIAESTLHAVGVFGQGGFEKNVEMNSQTENYVVFGTSGYNGDFNVSSENVVLDARIAEYEHPDGAEWVWTENIAPMRVYVGLKGKMEDGTDADADNFLARNGLRYGKLYGFAVDLSEDGPTGGLFRDEFHKSEAANNGAMIPGKMIAVQWSWDGIVKDFQHDVSWEYQVLPEPIDDIQYTWWNAGGLNVSGCKTEHITPDPRPGRTAMIQGSTCGYFGHLYIEDFVATLEDAGGDFPSSFDATYYVYQGERDVTSQIELGGKGQYSVDPPRDATMNWDSAAYDLGNGTATFEDIDGIEVLMGPDEVLHLILQEDSGSVYGERQFITSPLEHDDDGVELTYYFIAMSGGKVNTRMVDGVGIPAGVNTKPDSHEFSGIFDLSGLVAKDSETGEFVVRASDTGKAKRDADAMTPINEKKVYLSLQSHNMDGGINEAFKSDRGGQWLMYQPNIPN